MLQYVRRHVESFARERGLGRIDIQRSIVLDDSTQGTEGCILLIFGKTSEMPVLVAKAAPVSAAWTRAGKPVYEIEYENLRGLEQKGLNQERRTTPEPAGMWVDDGVLVTLQSALPGPLLKNVPGRTHFSPARADETIAGVLEWWLRFQRSFGVRRQEIDDNVYEREVLSPLRRFRQRFVTSREEVRFLERILREEKRLLGAQVPFVVRHGDFVTANIVLQPDGIGVFDWEFPLTHQLPLYDLFSFFASIRFPFVGARGESSHFESFLDVYWRDSHLNRIFRKSLGRVCAELEIPLDIAGELLVLSLIQVANLKYERLLEMHRIEPGSLTEHEATDAEKRSRWQSLGGPASDVPFACIRDGVFENLRHIANTGLPDLFET